jgi:hypothetical protein
MSRYKPARVRKRFRAVVNEGFAAILFIAANTADQMMTMADLDMVSESYRPCAG